MKKNVLRITIVCSVAALAALALGATHVYQKYRADLSLADARVHSISRFVKTTCGPIEYAVAGNGPPVLFIHGAGGGFDQGLRFGRPLVKAGFTVIAPSRFGYLHTPVPADVSPSAQADAHACLLDALGLSQVAVVGGSAGAPSAVQLCLRHPQRCSALVLVVPALFQKTTDPNSNQPTWLAQLVIRTTLQSDLLFWLATQVARDTMIESILATPIEDVQAASASEQQRVFSTLKAVEPIHERSDGLWIDATVTTAPSNYDLEGLRVPTLILTTANDGFGTFACSTQAAARIPAARLVSFPDGGHLWVGHEAAMSGFIEDFLRRQGETGPPS
jgi:2-hydroxy-6-oxonona-2,4-dienedioate hydrolase